MFNISDLVGTLLQSGMAKSSSGRLQNTFEVDDDNGGSGGGLGDLLGGLGGGLGDALSGMLGGAGGGANIGGMLQSVLGQASQAVGGNKNLAMGGLAALAGAVLGGGKKSIGGALGGGAMALLGAMAFKALTGSGQTEAAAAVPLGLREPDNDDEVQELESNAGLVFKSMIDAAKADGRIDQEEIQRIAGKVEEAGMGAEAREFIMSEMSKPIDTDSLTAAAAGRPELGAQIYAAALMAVEVDTPAEKAYLQQLAQGLGLAGGTVSRLEQMVGMNR
jgi:uncharacterized membrane protein YebE (DUF533 family)